MKWKRGIYYINRLNRRLVRLGINGVATEGEGEPPLWLMWRHIYRSYIYTNTTKLVLHLSYLHYNTFRLILNAFNW